MPSPIPSIYVDDSDEPKELPWKWVIHSSCEGHGTSSAYLGVFTRDDVDDDPEFFEEYRKGTFDRPCEGCDGGRVRVIDEDRCSPEDLAAYRKQLQDDAEDAAIRRSEMMLEGGWRDMY